MSARHSIAGEVIMSLENRGHIKLTTLNSPRRLCIALSRPPCGHNRRHRFCGMLRIRIRTDFCTDFSFGPGRTGERREVCPKTIAKAHATNTSSTGSWYQSSQQPTDFTRMRIMPHADNAAEDAFKRVRSPYSHGPSRKKGMSISSREKTRCR